MQPRLAAGDSPGDVLVTGVSDDFRAKAHLHFHRCPGYRLRTLAEDRETISPSADPTVAPITTRDVLQISNFTTAGKLGQTYSIVEADDPRSEADVELTWDAPDVSPADRRAHFTFVARDLRGGVGLATRTACVE